MKTGAMFRLIPFSSSYVFSRSRIITFNTRESYLLIKSPFWLNWETLVRKHRSIFVGKLKNPPVFDDVWFRNMIFV